MSVENDEVVALYRDKRMTMQAIGERLGITKSRVHQIPCGPPGCRRATATEILARPGSRASAYRAYRLTPETRELVERLGQGDRGDSRTAVVTRAVEELAARSCRRRKVNGNAPSARAPWG